MTDKQPKALRLAEYLMHGNPTTTRREAAEEMRRLHAANIDCVAHFDAIKSERDDLLEALKACLQELGYSNYSDEELVGGDYGIRSVLIPARAAIAKAEGGAA